jgi:trimeric autotransporter adhesin
MKFQSKRLGLALSIALTGAVLTLGGCGGGGGGSSTPPATTPPVTQTPPVALSGVVADGLIQGATVCYDLNANGVCDAGVDIFSASATGPSGAYSLSVPVAQAGKHAIVAMVPVGAVDSDTGPVTVAYGMKAPAQVDTSLPVFVSPITTIVQDLMVASGATDPTAAIAQVKTQLGMTISPLDNFIALKATGSTDAARAGTIAQVITAIKQQVATTAATAPAPPTAAATNVLITAVVLNNLSNIAASVTTQSTSAPTAIATSVVASVGLTTATVATQAQIATTIATAPPPAVSMTPASFVTLRDFRYTDANNWSYRVFTGDDVLQADGFKYSNDVRKQLVGGVDKAFNRNNAYFNTTTNAWYACPSDGYLAIRYTDPTAAGDNNSLYCHTYAASTHRAAEDIAGQTIGSVVDKIRASGLPGYNTWGLPSAALASSIATFPVGSKLSYFVGTDSSTPDGQSFPDKVRVMKDSTKPFLAWPFAAQLDEMVRFYPGNYNGATPNGGNSDGIGDIPDPTVTDTTLQQLKHFRVAYQATSPTAGNARFFQCRRNAASTGNTNANCIGANGQVVLDTTYTIETKADARVLRFAAFPTEVEAYRKFRRIYVERAGAVFYGFKDIMQTVTTVRMNQPAWDALRAQAPGVTAHTDPVAPVSVDAASWLADMRPGNTLVPGSTSTFTNTFNIRAFNSVATAGTNTGGTFSEVRMNIVQNTSVFTTISFVRNTMYWNGSAWLASDTPDNQCANNGVNIGTYTNNPRESVFCGLFKSGQSGFDVDISGKSVTATLAEMRLFGSYDSNGNDFSTYGPQPTPTDPAYASFTTAVFPAGSKLRYQVGTQITSADNFGLGSLIRLSTAGNPLASSLGSVTAVYTGSTTLAGINGANTLGIFSYIQNDLPAAGATTRQLVRVAFEPLTATTGNAKFYQCDQSTAVNNPPINCIQFDASYSSTYSISSQGGKNVLRFAGMPLAVQLYGGFERSYVEHGGFVYSMGKGTVGFKNYGQRLNQTAYDTIFNIFGFSLPAVTQ